MTYKVLTNTSIVSSYQGKEVGISPCCQPKHLYLYTNTNTVVGIPSNW